MGLATAVVCGYLHIWQLSLQCWLTAHAGVADAACISLVPLISTESNIIIRDVPGYNNNNNNDRLTAFDPGQPG